MSKIHGLITGIVYTEVDDALGPNPKLWIPSDMSEQTYLHVSIKTITLLTGEQGYVPKNAEIISFPSINSKGLVKYIQYEDENFRGGHARRVLTLLFNEYDDVIFYKYLKSLEGIFDDIARKLRYLEQAEVPNESIKAELETFLDVLYTTLEELRKNELSTKVSHKIAESELEITEDDTLYVFKLIVAGNAGVGKTSLILRFTDNAFSRTYIPTIGVNISEKTFKIGEEFVKLVLWDIAGQSQFSRMRKNFYRGADGAILVFDITNEKSFQDLSQWYEEIIKNKLHPKELKGFIIGNKSDLKENRAITIEDIVSYANNLEFPSIQTSALTGKNVEDAFREFAKILLDSRK